MQQRYVWQELSEPRTAQEKGGLGNYYFHPRVELLQLISRPPRLVLDVGCGGGATGAEVKKQFPQATIVGIELSQSAAAVAAQHLDRVLVESVEKLDYEAAGFAPGSIDLVFFPDVLEHLYDPWNVLRRIKPFLSENAQVLASIPNVRNFVVVQDLINGAFQYVEEGLLDVTHIRFFTRRSVIELFGQTGYSIVRMGANLDGRIPEPNAQPGATLNIDTPTFTLKNVSLDHYEEFRTIQYLVDATPVWP